MRVRIGKVRSAGASGVPVFDGDRASYVERVGFTGFGVEIEMGDRIDVTASWLLRRSPHVLYTNVVEPILRWAFVERGYALVHAACMADGGRACLITARTDTGKTTTALKTLDALPFSFLSDDLTLLCPDGRVLSYPKPLTISRHTLTAVKRPLLSRGERFALVFQSRLHSKSGRLFGLLLAKTRLPAATMNAIVQAIVPPPKYQVDRLVPHVGIASEANVTALAIIQREGNGIRPLDTLQALDVLMSNCEDAYGFPPYPLIEHFLHSRDGRRLRDVERNIVGRALAETPGTLLMSPTRDWFQQLPGVLGAHAAVVPARPAGRFQRAAALKRRKGRAGELEAQPQPTVVG